MSKITLDNLSNNLKEYLDSLKSSDDDSGQKIGDMSSLETDNKNTLVEAINELIRISDELKSDVEYIKENSDSYSILDINSSKITGTLIDDNLASHGKAFVGLLDITSMTLYSGEFSDVKFGNYALCLRLKSKTTDPVDILRVRVFNGDEEILNKVISGVEFTTNSNYQYFYSSFEYNGNGTKNKLRLQIDVIPISLDSGLVNKEVCFDYAYISMIIPSVYL